MQLNLSLHPKQLEVMNHPARFKIVVAGRRWGKSWLAAVWTLVEALKTKSERGIPLDDLHVFYVAPSLETAKRAVWSRLLRFGQPVIAAHNANEGTIQLINNRWIHLRGADRPGLLRGAGLSACVLDEFAQMRPDVWYEVVRPALADSVGKALIISTPYGKGALNDLVAKATSDWKVFQFSSYDNPFIRKDELDTLREEMSTRVFRQEILADMNAVGTGEFSESWFVVDPREPDSGNWYMAVDLGGFQNAGTKWATPLDETAIATVKVGPHGWWVRSIESGNWSSAEVARRIFDTASAVRPLAVGLEKGALASALMPELLAEARRRQVYLNFVPVSHGNVPKAARIRWALAAKLEHGRITFGGGPWFKKLVGQALDFPNPTSHDDMLDALAYIDKLVPPVPQSGTVRVVSRPQVVDEVVGF